MDLRAFLKSSLISRELQRKDYPQGRIRLQNGQLAGWSTLQRGRQHRKVSFQWNRGFKGHGVEGCWQWEQCRIMWQSRREDTLQETSSCKYLTAVDPFMQLSSRVMVGVERDGQ